MIDFGEKQTAWDLRGLLFATSSPRNLDWNIETLDLTVNEFDRLKLLEALHAEMAADLVAGGSTRTAKNRYFQLRKFLGWCDATSNIVGFSTVVPCFFGWANFLRDRSLQNEIKSVTVIDNCCCVSTMLDKILGRTRPLLKEVLIDKRRKAKAMRISPENGIMTTDLTEFGKFLRNLTDLISTKRMRGSDLIAIYLNEKGYTFSDAPFPDLTCLISKRVAARSIRHPAFLTQIINIRLEAELLIFIAQTGMNLEEAYTLPIDKYRYRSFNAGYQVISYKARRKGEVLFDIFSEYRSIFESYLAWRKDWCDVEDFRLFPIVRGAGAVRPPEFRRIRRLCNSTGLSYYGPRALRKTRQNWFLSQSYTAESVAEMGQHSVNTLLRDYKEINPQLALSEISEFHRKQDEIIMSVAPGACSRGQEPEAIMGLLSGGVEPDCANPSGCLFCVHHRDLDTSNHIWSMATFRFLKSLELAGYVAVAVQPASLKISPAEAVINRITEKLEWFRGLDEMRSSWVTEALAKVHEGYYHPAWDGFIRLKEIDVDYHV